MLRLTAFIFLLLSTFAALANFERGSARPFFPELTDDNANGQPLDTKTPLPNASGGWATNTNLYTARGELRRATDGLGTTEFTYDGNGNLASRKDRRGKTWTFTYNDDNQLEDTISPVTARRWERRYDARGLLATVREPSGQVTTYTPDALGRVDASADPVSTIDFSYDDEGRVETVQESAAGAPLLDRDYDALGRLTRYQHGSDYTLEWIYLDNDPVNKNAFLLRYPGGNASGSRDVRYDFDNRGRLWKVKDWNNRTTTYQYDNVGRLEWTYRPNGTKRHVSYDAASQIVKIEELNASNRVIALFSYPAYWANGQPAKEFSVPALPLGVKVHHAAMTYDTENRVATWNTLPVTHDDDGNMTSGPLPQATPGPGQPSPGFGNYAYDARNRLSTLNFQLSTTTYTYDAENLRTKVTTAAGNTQWVMNPAGSPPQPLVRIKPDGTVTRYVWGLGLLYEVADGDTQPTKTYHYDRRGSTVALSHADGLTVTDRWAYGPYGERLSHTGTSDTPFQFNGFFGVQTDPNGLLYMNARYYNTELRRFVSADPLGFGGGSNFYAFADGDPIMNVDPTGLWTAGIGIGGTAGLGIMPTVSAQVTGSVNGWNPLDWRIGVTESLGANFGSGGGISGGLHATISAATKPEEWNGTSGNFGSSFMPDPGFPVVIGGDIGNLGGGPKRYDGFLGIGASGSLPLLPWETHFGVSNTQGVSISPREVWNKAKDAWNGFFQGSANAPAPAAVANNAPAPRYRSSIK